MTTATDDGDDDNPTNPGIEAPSRPGLSARAAPPAPPSFAPRAPTLPPPPGSHRPPPTATSPGVRPSPFATARPTLGGGSGSAAGAPRVSALPVSPGERASSPPFLMPKPQSLAPGAGEPADPWRERLAAIEVQAQATRSLAQRTADDAAAVRQRAETAEARVQALEGSLVERLLALEKVSSNRAPTGSADTPPEGMGERLERVDRLTTQARVALDTIHQDLGEHTRLFAARKARLDSLDERVRKTENDPRLADLARKVESFDLTLSRLLPQLEAVAALAGVEARLTELGVRVADIDARFPPFDAELGAIAESLAVLRSDVSAMRERVSGLEARGSADSSAAASSSSTSVPADELRALKGVGPKLAKSLRELGVTTVAEVAAWNADDLADIAPKLGTTVAKIKKAGWVEAARAAVSGG